jgi:hypothetical protein
MGRAKAVNAVVVLPKDGQYFIRIKNEAAAIGEEYPVYIEATLLAPTHLGSVTTDAPLNLADIAVGPERTWLSLDVTARTGETIDASVRCECRRKSNH